MKLLGLHSEWAIFKDMWKDLIWSNCITLAYCGKRNVFKINDDDDVTFHWPHFIESTTSRHWAFSVHTRL